MGCGGLAHHALRLQQRLEAADVSDGDFPAVQLLVQLRQLLVLLGRPEPPQQDQWVLPEGQQRRVDDVAGDVVQLAGPGEHLEGLVLVEQVHGEVQQLLRLAIAADDLLGAVACRWTKLVKSAQHSQCSGPGPARPQLTVMDVQVDDGDSLAQFRVLLQGIHGSRGDVVEYAEAAVPVGVEQAVAAHVVSGRPHQAEGVPVLPRQHAVDCMDHRTWSWAGQVRSGQVEHRDGCAG